MLKKVIAEKENLKELIKKYAWQLDKLEDAMFKAKDLKERDRIINQMTLVQSRLRLAESLYDFYSHP